MTTLFLIRHGLTAVTGKTLYGRTPGIPLDDRGHTQAERLAERFSSIRLTAVYSSPLERCMQTMEPLGASHRLKVVPRADLIEMDAGTWTNRSLAQLRRTRLWRDVMEHPSQFRFPEGESFAEALARALAGVQAIVSHHPRGRVAVGSHGDVIRMLVAHHAGAPLDLFQRTVVDAASVSVVRVGNGEPRVLLVNDDGGSLARFAPPPRPERKLRG
jgi:probable phosphoglycerate mutase